MSEFVKGTDWSKISYRELQAGLAAIRAEYVEKYTSQSKESSDDKESE